MSESALKQKSGTPGAWLALICALLAVLVLVSLHSLSPEYLPQRHSLSQYANGGYGWLFTTGVVLFALALGAMAYSVVVEFPAEVRSSLGAFLLILAAFSFLFAAFFPADLGDVPVTITGQIHAWSLHSGTVVAFLASLLVATRLRISPRWLGWLSIALSLAAIAAGVFYRRTPLGVQGVQERAMYGFFAAWLVATALIGIFAPRPASD